MSGWQSMISILPPGSEIGVNFVGVDISDIGGEQSQGWPV